MDEGYIIYPGSSTLTKKSIIKIWSVGIQLKGVPYILRPKKLVADDKDVSIWSDKIDGTLGSLSSTISRETKVIFSNQLMECIQGIKSRGIAHMSLVPSHIWVRLTPPILLVGGLEHCTYISEENMKWEAQGTILILSILGSSSNLPAKTLDIKPMFLHPLIPETIMKELYEELSRTVSYLVKEKKMRKTVLDNCFSLFYASMMNPDMRLDDAKNCIMFSLFIALNISGIHLDYKLIPEGITDQSWCDKFTPR